MADTTINIIFSDGQVGGTESEPEIPGATPNPEAPEKTKKGGKEKDNALTMTKALALSAGKQAISAVTARVGNVTRSNVRQAKVNAGMKIASTGFGMGAALVSQNYAALAVMAISATIETASNIFDYNTSAVQEQRANQIRVKSYGDFNRSR